MNRSRQCGMMTAGQRQEQASAGACFRKRKDAVPLASCQVLILASEPGLINVPGIPVPPGQVLSALLQSTCLPETQVFSACPIPWLEPTQDNRLC